MTEYQEKINLIIDNIEKTFLGKRDVIKLLMIAAVAHGHVLIEDVPGVGKTSLANALAKSFDASFKRIHRITSYNVCYTKLLRQNPKQNI